MNIKKRVERIQKMIDKFDWEVQDLSRDENLKFYDIFLPSHVQPYAIEVRLKDGNNNSIVVARQPIMYDDLFYYGNFLEMITAEINRLQSENSPNQNEMVNELLRIRRIFGV